MLHYTYKLTYGIFCVYDSVEAATYAWSISKTPFALQTASELGHCPIPACSIFFQKWTLLKLCPMLRIEAACWLQSRFAGRTGTALVRLR
jgi:hypothetical protein